MDIKQFHFTNFIKRFGVIIGFLFIEQLIFLLSPQMNLTKLIFSDSQYRAIKNTIPFMYNPLFVHTLKICLSVVFILMLIAFIWSFIIKLDSANHIDTTRPLHKLPKKQKRYYWVPFVALAIIFAGNIIGNVIRLQQNGETITANQASLDTIGTSVSGAIWTILIIGIAIPIFEELLFRRLLIDYVGNSDNRKTFMILSVILFTSAHILASTNVFADTITYGVPAIVLTYLYVHFGNIRYGIYTHILMNMIASAPMFTIIFNYITQNMQHYFDILTNGSTPGH